MLYLLKIIYGFLLPPGLFITLLLLLSIWFFYKKVSYFKIMLLLTFIVYIFSIPLTGDLLIRSLENNYKQPNEIKGDVIIMLGAGAVSGVPDIDGEGQLRGSAANRLITTARLYRLTGLPIIVSGGQVFEDYGNEAEIAKRQLIGLGIPSEKIYVENKSLNTAENAQNSKEILLEKGFKRPILVTSAFHMDRSVKNFSQIGITVQPYPTDYLASLTSSLYANKFVPSNLTNVNLALKEYLGNLAIYMKHLFSN
ncbi:YdcF family protein [Niallia sp. 03133]|uniref:YdcF family protein n=1 Tax=Niallia sp. 03133 TaxID=3458060 RepID=UPI004043F6EA